MYIAYLQKQIKWKACRQLFGYFTESKLKKIYLEIVTHQGLLLLISESYDRALHVLVDAAD